MGIKIALAGNPNCGKTTMFNALTGSNQYVGNWPGVTVEKKEGRFKADKSVVIQDLPGIYSLSPYTLEEVISRNYLVNERPDAIVNILDGTNIERNLYLTTQLIELGIPVVVAVNMIDVVRKNGDSIDLDKLSKALGCEVFETSALKGEGSESAVLFAEELAKSAETPKLPAVFNGSVEHAIAHIEESLEGKVDSRFLRWYAVKAFERDEKVMQELKLSPEDAEHIDKHISDCEGEMDDDAESIITNQRYSYISKVVGTAVKKGKKLGSESISDKIDKVVTNRILALPIFALIMWAVYSISIGTVGDWTVGFMNDTLFGEWIQGGLSGWFESMNVVPWLSSLVVDGIVGGVGAVLGFVPQLLILFLLLSVLEDVGYMARVAFIMDRIFRKFGLSGKSFIPMLIGSGCAIPGIMASRTIENERDRRMTVMTTSFIPCGAKMPIVGLIAAALFNRSPWVAVSAYFIGVAAVVISGIILKKTKAFAGEVSPFVMELPSYHVPSAGNVFRATWERGWSFIKRAGTVIVAASVLIWFLGSFSFEGGFHWIQGDEKSVLNAIGSAIAIIFKPLGFGYWQAAVATIMGLVAKEEVVGVFGVLSSIGSGDLALEMVEAGNAAGLLPIGQEFFGGSGLSAYSFMIFNLLCAPCFAACGAIKREMNNPRWTLAAIAYLCGFAYSISLMVYQFGRLFTGSGFGVGTAAAIILFVALCYLLLRRNKYDLHN